MCEYNDRAPKVYIVNNQETDPFGPHRDYLRVRVDCQTIGLIRLDVDRRTDAVGMWPGKDKAESSDAVRSHGQCVWRSSVHRHEGNNPIQLGVPAVKRDVSV